MRAYFFGNMYLSSIQQGIQAAHVTAELFTKYDDPVSDVEQQFLLQEWATNHKTMILLNGGYGKNLHNLYQMFDCPHSMGDDANRYPFAKFHEEQDALDGAITSVGIVLPERIYALVSAVKSKLFSFDDLSAIKENYNEILGGGVATPLYLRMMSTEAALKESYPNFDIAHAFQQINTFDIKLIKEITKYNLAS